MIITYADLVPIEDKKAKFLKDRETLIMKGQNHTCKNSLGEVTGFVLKTSDDYKLVYVPPKENKSIYNGVIYVLKDDTIIADFALKDDGELGFDIMSLFDRL